MHRLKAFISSTWLDMRSERQAVEKVVDGMHGFEFVGMEHFGARQVDTRTMSLKELNGCHVYVGIIGHAYGGITELEYRRARDLDLPCLIFIKAAHPSRRKARLIGNVWMLSATTSDRRTLLRAVSHC